MDIDIENYGNYLNEIYSSIQIDNECSVIVNEIIEDIKNKIYLNYCINDKIETSYYKNIKYEFPIKFNDIYKLQYKNINCSWIKNLDILIIVPAKNCKTVKGISYPAEYDWSIYINDYIEQGTIVLVLNNNINEIEGTIYHELKHYYIYWLRFLNNKEKIEFNDLTYFNNYISLTNTDLKNVLNTDINNFFKNDNITTQLNWLNAFFHICCYYLNSDEKYAKLENIITDYKYYINNHNNGLLSFNNKNFCNYSKTFNTYSKINNILKYIVNNIPDKLNIQFTKIYGGYYYQLFTKNKNDDFETISKYYNLKRLSKKFIYKLNKMCSNFNKISTYYLNQI